MQSPKNKIIQKRVRRRERYARMARIRHRRDKNVPLAKAQNITYLKPVDENRKIYQFSSGFCIGEVDGKLEYEVSMLNHNYISNCVTVIEDESHEKLLCCQLKPNPVESKKSDLEIVEEWEAKGDPMYTEWAARFRKFFETSNNFMMKNMDKLQQKKVDKDQLERAKQYAAFRKEMLSTKPAFERRSKYGIDSYHTEMIFNSKFVATLGYEFDEFVNVLLTKGLPKLKPSGAHQMAWLKETLEHAEDFFSTKVELPKLECHLLRKDGSEIKVRTNCDVMGYFVRHGCEIHAIKTFDILEETPVSPVTNSGEADRPLTPNELERKQFLDMFYANRHELLAAEEARKQAIAMGLDPDQINFHYELKTGLVKEEHSLTGSSLSCANAAIKMEDDTFKTSHLDKSSRESSPLSVHQYSNAQ